MQRWTPALNFTDLAASPLPGQDGNVEYFLWMKRRMSTALPKIEERDEPLRLDWPNLAEPLESGTR